MTIKHDVLLRAMIAHRRPRFVKSQTANEFEFAVTIEGSYHEGVVIVDGDDETFDLFWIAPIPEEQHELVWGPRILAAFMEDARAGRVPLTFAL